ncbi:MAG: threonine/serine dehydratase [Candidatus Eiseniibacteriota bacterium]|jgi:threonine dehydratase
MVTIDDVRRAHRAVGPHVHRTPTVRSRSLGDDLGCEAWLKLELFQKTGSFKPRGALHYLLELDAAARRRGVLTISAGNHAQGLAYAARRLDVAATVVMPESAPRAKVDATRGYGAEVVLHGDVHQAFEEVRRLESERDLVFVHPFDHPHIVAGHGGVGLELLDDVPHPHRVVVPIGGGGLIAGVAVALKALSPSTRLIGVEPVGADAMCRSRAAGAPVRLERIATIADGLAPPFVGTLNFEIAERCVDDLVTVTDAELVGAMRYLMTRVKVVAEPAGAAAVAAVLAGRVPVGTGERLVCIVSGGNVEPARLADWLGGTAGGSGRPGA